MDASVTSAGQWTQVTAGLIWFWMFPVCTVVFGACILLAHGLIPSLVSTRQLPHRVLGIRPVFYALAIVFLGGAIFSFAQIVTHLSVLYDIYGKLWI